MCSYLRTAQAYMLISMPTVAADRDRMTAAMIYARTDIVDVAKN
jgi:hypothetical protein